jgi:hypothetical protein
MKMKKLTFYHQVRCDGGTRTGVEMDEDPVLERFEAGSPPEDSRLLWWIDVRCTQRTWPDRPEEVRAWLLEKAQIIEKGLNALAAELGAGIDVDWPAKYLIPGRAGAKIEIVCSAMRRVDGLQIGGALLELASNWRTILAELPSWESAVVRQ